MVTHNMHVKGGSGHEEDKSRATASQLGGMYEPMRRCPCLIERRSPHVQWRSYLLIMPEWRAMGTATYGAWNCALVLLVLNGAFSFSALQLVVHAPLPLHAHIRGAKMVRRSEVARTVEVVGEGDDVGVVASIWVAVAAATAAPLA
eukprot:6212912-Pleurochrysis_carterae.AAC.5